MKKQKSILIALPLVLAMLFVSLAPFAVVPAKADDDDLDLIYYFSDYYPTLDVATLNENFPDYGVVYHHQWATETTLYNAVMQGVPSGVTFHTVIIDIKSFVPSGATMSAIFSYFAAQGCQTVFVSPYEPGDFDNDDFFAEVDRYCYSNLSTLYGFIDWALDEMYNHNGDTLSNTTILIDGRLIDPFYNGPETLEDRFHFYRVLLEVLTWPNYNSPTNVHLLVHRGSNPDGNSFYDLSSDPAGNSYVASGIDDFTDANGNCIWENICAMGFWELEDDFYQYILNNQSSPDDMPLYTLRVDPPVYGEDGVAACMFTMDDAREMGEEDPEKPFETDALLALIASLLP